MKKFLLKKSTLFISFFILSLCSSRAFAFDVIVAKDGSGNFTTIGAAINAAPTGRTTPYTIFIKNGKYKEKDTIPSNKPFIQLVGESVANVIISWDDFSGKAIPGGGTYGTGNSATVTVNAPDFTAINITFENTTGEQPQALAINVVGDRAAFKNCRFLGGQDTVFAGGNGARQYFNACYIDGTVDFIFGDARAVFDSTVIYPKSRSSAGASYMTAPNTKQTEPYGYVFRNCVIPANRGGTVYYLGRPWQNDGSTADAAKSYNKTVFINTTISPSVIQPAGWSTWDAGTDVTKITYAEYRSKKFDSTLVDVSQRVSWSKQMTAAEAANYSNTNLFGTWDPCNVYPGFCDYTPRPIAVSNFKGVKGPSTSAFTWNISWPMTGILYEVLRSNNKTNFTVVNQQTSTNDSTVNFGYTENVPPPGVTYYYIVRASKNGLATHITDTVTISSTPTITVTGAMGGFLQGIGTPSAAQSYVVSASSLTNNLIITAPTAYELSTNGSTWNISANPLVFTQDANGNVANTTIFVRLNATAAGTYSGNIIHASQGADTVKLAVTGTVQSTPLTVSDVLQWYPMAVNATDSASVRSVGVTASTPTLNIFSVSDGVSYDGAAIPAYSSTHGQALSGAPGGTGDWRTASGGPGGNLTHVHYEQFTVTSATGFTARIDSLILNNSFYLSSSNTKLAVQYSLSGFTTDSSEVSAVTAGGTTLPYLANSGFTKAVALPNENGPTTYNLRIALNSSTGITVPAGQTLSVRLYFSCGSSSRNRYAKIKDLMFKGLSTKNPLAGDYRTHQTGVWSDVNTWEKYDGTSWVNPAPEFPHYSNTSGTIIQTGHTVTLGSSFTEGFGYIPRRTQINKGGQLIVNTGANLNIANDGTPAAATTDLQVDGTLTVNGGMFSNGNVAIAVNGSFINASTSMNLSNGGDTVFVGANGIWEQKNNSTNTPARFSFEPTSIFNITGLTSALTGLFKNNVKYGNIIWNNAGESANYAVRTTLDSSNVKGSFIVQSTGTSFLSFANSSARTSFPGGYYQTGGIVNYREGNNVIDTLDLGGDFSVTGGTFNSTAPIGSSLLIRLNGVNKTINYNQANATNTNWNVGGTYNLGSNVNLASSGFGMNVSGSLDAGANVISGSGDFTLLPGAIFSSGAAAGLNGNITATGAKTFSNAATYVFNGTVAQTTGALLPATVGYLTINNLNDVTLSGSASVTNALTLASGHLILGNNNVTASSVLNGSSAKYVITNGTGVLKVNSIGAGTNLFPVGTSITAYNPVTLNNAGTADNFSVSVKNTFDNPVPDPTKVVNKQWIITEEVAGGSNATVSLVWLATDQAAGFNPANASSIIRFNGTTWQSYPATITGAGTTASPYVATASGITSFSPFTVVNDAALPLNILSFNAGFVGNTVSVKWTTTNEINTALFNVERSIDGRSFSNIGTLNAKNNTRETSYSFVDGNPEMGVSYYRLAIIDKDGTIKYSRTVTMNSTLRGVFSVYPNPATHIISVTHSKAGKNAIIEIVNINGNKVIAQKLSLDATQTSIDVSTLPAGSYNIVLLNGGEKIIMPIVKQ